MHGHRDGPTLPAWPSRCQLTEPPLCPSAPGDRGGADRHRRHGPPKDAWRQPTAHATVARRRSCQAVLATRRLAWTMTSRSAIPQSGPRAHTLSYSGASTRPRSEPSRPLQRTLQPAHPPRPFTKRSLRVSPETSEAWSHCDAWKLRTGSAPARFTSSMSTAVPNAAVPSRRDWPP